MDREEILAGAGMVVGCEGEHCTRVTGEDVDGERRE